jgi:hypothetical protein
MATFELFIMCDDRAVRNEKIAPAAPDFLPQAAAQACTPATDPTAGMCGLLPD